MRNPKAQVSDPNKFITFPGSDDHILYDSKLLPSGEIVLTPNGKESISEKINAEKEYTDIRYICQRLALGDTSVVRPASSLIYTDLTSAPKTLAESLQIFINARSSFDSLDLETKNKFDNNYLRWLQDAGTKEWSESMSKYLPQKEADDLVIEKEVTTNES